MDVKILTNKRKYVLIYSLIIYMVMFFIYIAVSLALNINIDKVESKQLIKIEEKLVNTEKNVIANRINRIISDVLYISDTLTFNDSNLDDFKNIQNEWKMFSDRKKVYDQIRYIDLEGKEKIRINYSEDGAIIVNEDNLQNKKKRSYFKDSIKLKQEQIYISNIDLNIENGKVEEPIKPMIRMATPVFTKDGQLKGIVILDYYAKHILKQVEDIASTSVGNIVMIDCDGNWIYNSKDKEKQWTFMYEDKKNISFKNEFKNEFNSIKENKTGGMLTENGYFYYTNVMSDVVEGSDSIVLGEGDWRIVSMISKDSEYGRIFFLDWYGDIIYILENNKVILSLIFIISVVVALLFVINKISNEEVKYFSEYDTMTDVFNRRAGVKRLTQMYMNAKKNSGILSVCFIDINGLKQVNDDLGHEAGDELILSVINTIKKYVRTSDVITRLGGDEFLIVFDNTSNEEAEYIWKRITDEFKKISETENRVYIISASHGIQEFRHEMNQSIDDIINLADEKMYNEKKIIKKNL